MKHLSALLLLLTLTLQARADELIDRLMATGFFTSVTEYQPKDRKELEPEYWQSVYELRYQQPLCHANPSLGTFSLRAILVLNSNNEDRLNAPVNQVYIGGYEIQEVCDKADFCYPGKNSCSEIAYHYGGNVLYPEHRYFGQSCPTQEWNRLEYCNADEAAQDFAALTKAFHKAMGGKVVLTGVSKGGICTSIQSILQPDCADLFISYAGPWCQGQGDERLINYVYNNTFVLPTGNELHTNYEALMTRMLSESVVRQHYQSWYHKLFPKEAITNFLYIFYSMSNEIACYVSRENLTKFFAQVPPAQMTPSELGYYLACNKADSLNHAAYLRAVAKYGDALQPVPASRNRGPQEMGWAGLRPDAVSEYDFNNQESMPYYYQASRELGYYRLVPLNRYYTSTTEAQQLREADLAFLNTQQTNLPFSVMKFSYSDALYQRIMQGTRNTQRPVIYLYGGDDFWTGAAIEDQYINGNNVRKFILEGQNHNVAISGIRGTSYETTTAQQLWDLVDSALRGQSSAIDTIDADDAATDSSDAATSRRVILRDGHLLIEQGQRTYDLNGRLR